MTIDARMWSALFRLAVEAVDACEPEEQDFMRAAIAADPAGAVTAEFDGNLVTVSICGRRLVTAHKLSLTKPASAPATNN